MHRYLIFAAFLLLASSPALADERKGNELKNEGAIVATAAHFAPPLNWFTATNQGDGTVQLQWSSEPSQLGMEYLVERSQDGQSYTTIATLSAIGSRFLYLDNKNEMDEIAYYRISARKGGQAQVVSQVLLSGAVNRQELKMTAEETYDGQLLQLNIFAQATEAGSLSILDTNGEVIRQENLLLNNGYNRVLLSDFNQLQTGAYFLTLQTSNGLSTLKLQR